MKNFNNYNLISIKTKFNKLIFPKKKFYLINR